MYRIGTVNIDTSHAPSFAEILLQGDVARYTAIYNDGFRTDEEVNAFMEKFGVTERYTDLAEMAKHIDIAFIQSCNWDRHIELSMPFIEAGVPVFIDKPLVGNLKDCHTLEKLAEEGKVILGTSAMRYTYERDSFFAVPDEQRGKIIHVTTMVGVDEFNYAIHSIESILGFLKGDSAVSCRYIGGGLVDDAALVEALKNGKLAGAGLDCVEEEESDVTKAMCEMSNVVITPHIGGTANDLGRVFLHVTVRNVVLFVIIVLRDFFKSCGEGQKMYAFPISRKLLHEIVKACDVVRH